MSPHWKSFWGAVGSVALVGGVVAGTWRLAGAYADWKNSRESRERAAWLRVHAPDAGVTCIHKGTFATTLHCSVTHARFAAPVELTCDTDGCSVGCR